MLRGTPKALDPGRGIVARARCRVRMRMLLSLVVVLGLAPEAHA